MALDFSAVSTDRVDFGVVTAIANADPLTFWCWVFPTAAATTDHRLMNASQSGHTLGLRYLSTDELEFGRTRASVNTTYLTNTSPLSTLNKWYFVAMVFDTGASAGEVVQIYTGDLTTPASEETYGTATDGIGSLTTMTTAPLLVGNRTPNNRNTPGYIAAAGFISRAVPLPELLSIQFDSSRVVPNTELHVHLGVHGSGGVGTQLDWAKGLTGTITGATKVDHAPIRIFPTPVWIPAPAVAAEVIIGPFPTHFRV